MSGTPLKFGEQLVEAGLVRPEQLESALGRQRAEGGYMSELLIDEGVPEEPLLRFVAAAAGASWITEEALAHTSRLPEALGRIPLREAEKMCVLPLSWNAHERALDVAVPNLSPDFLERARAIAKAAKVRPRLALRRAIRAGIKRLYQNDPYAFARTEPGAPQVRVEETSNTSVVARMGTPALGIPRGTVIMGRITQPAQIPTQLESAAPLAKTTGTVVMGRVSSSPGAATVSGSGATSLEAVAPLRQSSGTMVMGRPSFSRNTPAPPLGLRESDAPTPPEALHSLAPAAEPASENSAGPSSEPTRDPVTIPATGPGNEPALPAEWAVATTSPEVPLEQLPTIEAFPEAPTATGPQQTLLQLYETLETQQREIHLLRVANQLHIDLARARDLPTLIERVMAFAFDYVPADDGVLLLRDAPGRPLRPHLTRTRSGDNEEVVVSQTLLAEVESTREGVLSTDAAYDQRFSLSKTVIASRLRSAIGVPLIVANQVRGVIVLSTRGRGGMFTGADLAVLSAIAAQSSVAIENIELAARLAEDVATRDRLSRFLSPELVELAASGAALQGTGEVREATILFADIRGFTTLAESLSPEQTLELLNAHFEAMVEVVFSFGGFLDKFLGDGVMAVWGVTTNDGDSQHAERAMRAALEMQRRVRAVCEARVRHGQPPYQIGIGIHTGDVVFGAVGASRRRELTVVGDSVNTASRLCAWAEGGQTVVTEAAMKASGSAVPGRLLPSIQLKGKTREVRMYELLDE